MVSLEERCHREESLFLVQKVLIFRPYVEYYPKKLFCDWMSKFPFKVGVGGV